MTPANDEQLALLENRVRALERGRLDASDRLHNLAYRIARLEGWLRTRWHIESLEERER